jgi:hypothetical protein
MTILWSLYFRKMKVRRSGGDARQGGQFLEDELRDFLHGLPFQHHREVITAGHEIHRADFVELGDVMGDRVKAFVLLGRDLDFNEGIGFLFVLLAPVDDGLIADDEAIFL